MENLSKRKRDEMIAFLEFLKKQHSDDDSLMAINSIERELTAKKYGLIWEEHQEEVDKKMETHIPVFSEVPEYEVMEDEHNTTFNFLLEGDNLHSLNTFSHLRSFYHIHTYYLDLYNMFPKIQYYSFHY